MSSAFLPISLIGFSSVGKSYLAKGLAGTRTVYKHDKFTYTLMEGRRIPHEQFRFTVGEATHSIELEEYRLRLQQGASTPIVFIDYPGQDHIIALHFLYKLEKSLHNGDNKLVRELIGYLLKIYDQIRSNQIDANTLYSLFSLVKKLGTINEVLRNYHDENFINNEISIADTILNWWNGYIRSKRGRRISLEEINRLICGLSICSLDDIKNGECDCFKEPGVRRGIESTVGSRGINYIRRWFVSTPIIASYLLGAFLKSEITLVVHPLDEDEWVRAYFEKHWGELGKLSPQQIEIVLKNYYRYFYIDIIGEWHIGGVGAQPPRYVKEFLELIRKLIPNMNSISFSVLKEREYDKIVGNVVKDKNMKEVFINGILKAALENYQKMLIKILIDFVSEIDKLKDLLGEYKISFPERRVIILVFSFTDVYEEKLRNRFKDQFPDVKDLNRVIGMEIEDKIKKVLKSFDIDTRGNNFSIYYVPSGFIRIGDEEIIYPTIVILLYCILLSSDSLNTASNVCINGKYCIPCSDILNHYKFINK